MPWRSTKSLLVGAGVVLAGVQDPDRSFDGLAARLAAALPSDGRTADAIAVRRIAARLRGALRRDAAAAGRAAAAVLDPGTEPALRCALALVLGTLPGERGDAADAVLLDALERFSGEPDTVRCTVLALGSARPSAADDDLFGPDPRGDGVDGPGGLVATVRRRIDSAAVVRPILALMSPAPAGAAATVRHAAALALRHSLATPAVRDAFVAALIDEADDRVAGVLAGAVAGLLGGVPHATSRAVVEALIAAAARPELTTCRERAELALIGARLDSAVIDRLLALARSPHADAVQRWSLRVLTRSGSEHARTRAAARLLTMLEDSKDAVRRARACRVAEQLGSRAHWAYEALAEAAELDPDPSVRREALSAIARCARRELAIAILDRGRSDRDPDVVARAESLLTQFRARRK